MNNQSRYVFQNIYILSVAGNYMVIITIGRKEAIFFGAIILVFVVAGIAVAYNSGADPAVMGHSVEELELRCVHVIHRGGTGDVAEITYDSVTGNSTTDLAWSNILSISQSTLKVDDYYVKGIKGKNGWAVISCSSADHDIVESQDEDAYLFEGICGEVMGSGFEVQGAPAGDQWNGFKRFQMATLCKFA